MKRNLLTISALGLLIFCTSASAQKLTTDIPYVDSGHERHVLDIYTPENASAESLP